MVPMCLRAGRALAACLIGAGCAAWGLAGGLPGTALAAAGSQCEALPAGSSASASASQAELCVSVQASQSGIKRGRRRRSRSRSRSRTVRRPGCR